MVLITPPQHTASAGISESSHDLLTPATCRGPDTAAALNYTFDEAVEILGGQQPPPQSAPIRDYTLHDQPPPTTSSSPPPRIVDLWSDTVEEIAPPPEIASAVVEPQRASESTAAIGAPPCSSESVELADTIDESEDAEGTQLPAASSSNPQDVGHVEPLLPTEKWISPRTAVWRQWALLGGAAALGMGLAIAVFGYAARYASRSLDLAVAVAPADAAPVSKDSASEPETANSTTTDEAEESPTNTPSEPAEEVGSLPPAPAEPPSLEEESTTGDSPSMQSNPVATVENSAPPMPESEPIEVASNADVLEKFGDFLNSSFDAAPDTLEPSPEFLDEDTRTGSDAPSDEDDSGSDESSVPRPPLRPVDVEARLADPLVEIEVNGTPLWSFLTFISDLSTIPISIEPEALAWRGLSPTTAVSVRESNSSVGDVLTAAFKPLGLAYRVDDGHLIVTTQSAREGGFRQLKHPVEDLTGGDPERLAQLGELITRMIAPESWKEAGGAGMLMPHDGGLMIQQTERVHFQVIAFCETLRTARGMALRTRFNPALFQPQAPQHAIRSKLATPISLNYRRPTQLTTILDALGKAAGVSILVDWRAAATAGWPPNAKGSVVGDGAPLSETLTRLLTPMDLAYRVVDGATLEVTTLEELHSRTEARFYPVEGLLARGITEADLIERIQSELGEPLLESGAIVFHLDQASKHLIAALPQPQHDKLAELLNALRKP